MCLEKESENVYNYILQNQPNHTLTLKIMESYSVTRLFGLLMTPMFTELQSTKHLKVILQLNQSMEQYSYSIQELDSYS